MEIIKIKELKSILEDISAKKIFSNSSIEIIEIDLMPDESIPCHVNEKTTLFNIIDGKAILIIDDKKIYHCKHYIKKETKCWDLPEGHEIHKFARNEGFDYVNNFFDYFKEYYKGKIIHWTNFKY